MQMARLYDRHHAYTLKGLNEVASFGGLPVPATDEQLARWREVLEAYERVQGEMRRAAWLGDIAYHENNSSNGNRNDEWHAGRARRLREQLAEAEEKGEFDGPEVK